MQEVYEFLKKCGTYYLATDEGGQPRVRPFGTKGAHPGLTALVGGQVVGPALLQELIDFLHGTSLLSVFHYYSTVCGKKGAHSMSWRRRGSNSTPSSRGVPSWRV